MNPYKNAMSAILPPATSKEEAGLRDTVLNNKSKEDARRLTAKELASRLTAEKTALKALDPNSQKAAVSRLKIHAMEAVVDSAPGILAPTSRPDINGDIPQNTSVPSPEELAQRNRLNPYRAVDPSASSQTPRVDRVVDALSGQEPDDQTPAQARAPLPERPSPAAPSSYVPATEIERNVLKSLKGNVRPETAKLMQALNINLSVALSRKETADLIAALLTCNETQLDAIASNSKTPIAVCIIIKRLKEDLKNGNLSTVDFLWDRIFGKDSFSALRGDAEASTAVDLSRAAIRQGRLPDVPVSREAYVLIRETLLG